MAARSSAMVGRDAELSLLLDSLGRATSGQAQVVVVRGEAGIGKTRLVRELVERAPEGAVAAFGHAVPLSGGALPYGVVSDLLRGLVREIGGAAVVQVLGERAPLLAPVVPRLGEGAPGPVDRPALFAATQDLLVELSAGTTLALVVEDLHWSDSSSIDLLMFWSRTIVHGRLMLLVTSRDTGVDDEVRRSLREIERLPDATSVDLAPLPADEVARQAHALDSTLEGQRLAEIQRLSEGIPLYVEELVAGGRDSAVTSVGVDLLARLRSLAVDDERVLRLAALERRPVDSGRLAHVAEADTSEVESVLGRAAGEGLLIPGEDGTYSFRHELLRIAADESSSAALRHEGHRRWAGVLTADIGDTADTGDTADIGDLVSAADHWATLGPSREAFLARTEAADAVWGVAGSRDASAQWMLALRMIHADQTVATEEEHDEVLGAWTALQEVRGPEYGEVLAVEETVTGPEPSIRRHFLDLSADIDQMYEHGWGEPDSVLERVAEHRRRLERHPPTMLSFQASVLLLRACWFVERYDDEFELCLDVLDRAAPDLSDRKTTALSQQIVWRALTRQVRDDDAASAAYWQEAVQATTGLDSRSRSRILDRASIVTLGQADFATALQLGEEVRRLLRGPEVDGLWNTAALTQAHAHASMGMWDQAVDEARLVWSGSRWARQRLEAFWVQAHVLLDQGRREEVLALVDGVSAWDPARTATLAPDSYTHAVRAAMLAADDPAAALKLLAGHFGTDLGVFDHRDRGLFGRSWSLAAELSWRVAPPPPYVDRLRAGLARTLTLDPLGSAWLVEAEAHLARASGAEGQECWRVAVQTWDDVGAPFLAARCRLRLAEVQLREGDRDKATHVSASALTTAESLGAKLLVDQICTLADRGRLPLPGRDRGGRTHVAGLTAREREVLELLVQGLTNDQIGSALFMSPRTASVHVSHILQKLGASNRTEVASIVHRGGLLEAD